MVDLSDERFEKFENPEKYALEYFSNKFHAKTFNLLKTRDARKIHTKLLRTFFGFFKSKRSRLRFMQFYLTKDMTELKRRFDLISSFTQLELVDFDIPEIVLSRNVKLNDVCFCTSDFDYYKSLKSEFPNFPIFFVESNSDLSLIKGYSQVRTDSAEIEQMLPNAVLTSTPFPEVIIENIKRYKNEFSILKDAIKANSENLKMLGIDVSDLNLRLDSLFEFSSLKYFDFVHYLKDKIVELNSMIDTSIKNMNFNGKELLESLSKKELPDKIKEMLGKEFESMTKELSDKMNMNVDFHSLISMTYPLEINESLLEDLNKEFWNESLYRNFTSDMRYLEKIGVRSFSDLEGFLDEIFDVVNYLDFALGIKKIVETYDLGMPEFIDKGFELSDAKSIFLHDKTSVEPITYSVDSSVLLTGANSGGKTSLLELIAQSFILAFSGFFVPGNSKIGLVDSLYFFSKPTKGTDAGAFETLLTQFSKIKEPNSLILADEIEAITEPGAAAKILKSIIEWFKSAIVIIVTHLGEDLKDSGIKCDGIQAVGISNGKLIVNRSPIKGIIAKSTPQLILEKIKGENEFFQYLLDHLSE